VFSTSSPRIGGLTRPLGELSAILGKHRLLQQHCCIRNMYQDHHSNAVVLQRGLLFFDKCCSSCSLLSRVFLDDFGVAVCIALPLSQLPPYLRQFCCIPCFRMARQAMPAVSHTATGFFNSGQTSGVLSDCVANDACSMPHVAMGFISSDQSVEQPQ